MLVQFSTKIKAVKRLHTQTPSCRQSHTVAQEAHECWVDQFGTLSTYITKLEVEILNDIYIYIYFSFYIRTTVKELTWSIHGC